MYLYQNGQHYKGEEEGKEFDPKERESTPCGDKFLWQRDIESFWAAVDALKEGEHVYWRTFRSWDIGVNIHTPREEGWITRVDNE